LVNPSVFAYGEATSRGRCRRAATNAQREADKRVRKRSCVTKVKRTGFRNVEAGFFLRYSFAIGVSLLQVRSWKVTFCRASSRLWRRMVPPVPRLVIFRMVESFR